MPQLDFREALSTPEDKLFSPAPAAAVPAAAMPVAPKFDFLARGLRLTRSTWTNIIFVTIASVGGLFSAFYFFNGAEVLRAAASWPSEFLYPRPLSADKIDIGEQPNPVDTFNVSSGSDSSDATARKGPFDQNVWPSDLAQPAIGTSPLTAPGVFNDTGFVLVPSGPGSSLFSTVDSLVEGLNLLPPGGDALFQSVYQMAVSTATSTTTTVKKTVRSTVGTVRRKVSSASQKLTTQTSSASSTVKSTTQTTTQTMQQTTTLNQTQVGGGMNAIQAPSQTMIGSGLGGVGGVGGVGGTVGGLGGTVGGIVGGLGGHH